MELELDTSLEEFKYQGVTYSKKFVADLNKWIVFNVDEDEVGEWIEKIPGDIDDEHIDWIQDWWKDIHESDDNYTEE